MLNILDMTADTNNFRVMDLESINADVTFDDDYSLKLTSKKLQSGKCQVKFYANVHDRRDMYGYVLVDSDKTLKDVVIKIKEKLRTIRQTREFHHLHLYSIGKMGDDDLNFIIFDS
ncbi:MAG TPA: hypothetical protein DHN29_09435 [Cytophagales bacterium]|nr:hypothetical protein [Cytophagales bacterium]|tara:strand:+ start:482 stop:829 length:348 start_codon:yes stop_codon:yes gene_type:complete